MAPIVRADHVGSLLRPKELLEARRKYFAKRMTLDELRAIEDEAILQVLSMQREVGMEFSTDGEYRRAGWNAAWAESVEGIAPDPLPYIDRPAGLTGWKGEHGEDANASMQGRIRLGEAPAPSVVTAKLRLKKRLTADEAGFLRKHAQGFTKVTMPGVMMAAAGWYRPEASGKAYPTRDDLVRDMVGIMQAEVKALMEDGIDCIQFDSLRYAWFMDPALSQRLRASGVDIEREIDATVAADNACMEGVDRDQVVFGLHICRGNNTSAWLHEGAYDPIAERSFSELRIDRLFLEYDTDRAGGFEPLRFVRKGTTVVLGLVSSKVPQLESVDDLRRRVDEAARYIPLEYLALSPQCGFASSSSGNLLTWDEQRRKLELVCQTARKIWG